MVSPEKILIIRLSAMGDILLATPLLRALRRRFPTARLDFVVKSQFADVLRYHPAIDHLYELNPDGGWQELRALASRLQEARYDVIFDIHKNFRSRYLAAAAKPRRILRHHKHFLRRWLLVKTKINFMANVPPIYQRYLAAAKPLGVSASSPVGGRWLELFWSEREEQEAERALVAQNRQPHLPLVGLAPGAGYFTKRWPPEYFAELAFHFIQSGNQVVVLGAVQDAGLVQTMMKHLKSVLAQQQLGAGFINLAGAISLLASAAIIKRCQLLVANDSGLMHVAEAVGTPLIAIFGSTTRDLGFFPQLAGSRVVENHDLLCRPCSHLGHQRCPLGHFRCMRDIRPDEIEAAAKELLGEEKFARGDP
jgi:heptosyltransferase-2